MRSPTKTRTSTEPSLLKHSAMRLVYRCGETDQKCTAMLLSRREVSVDLV
jgi:hypothetical protein